MTLEIKTPDIEDNGLSEGNFTKKNMINIFLNILYIGYKHKSKTVMNLKKNPTLTENKI